MLDSSENDHRRDTISYFERVLVTKDGFMTITTGQSFDWRPDVLVSAHNQGVVLGHAHRRHHRRRRHLRRRPPRPLPSKPETAADQAGQFQRRQLVDELAPSQQQDRHRRYRPHVQPGLERRLLRLGREGTTATATAAAAAATTSTTATTSGGSYKTFRVRYLQMFAIR